MRKYLLLLGTVGIGLAGQTAAAAGLDDLSGQYASNLEELAAKANQATYDDLLAAGCVDEQRTATTACSGTTYIVFQNARELVHTANDLANNGGPTQYSLGLDLQGLGFALRWTSGEEFAAQGSLSNNFVNGQLSGLASRITALRYGARGFMLGGYGDFNNVQVAAADLNGQTGGGASADGQWSRWGGFLNASDSWGDKGPTQLEDAFDFDGRSLTGGFDYRYSNRLTFGATVGYQDEKIDFDSSLSIVDGSVKMSGYSIMPFILYQPAPWYVSFSLGYQSMDFDTRRVISYPSLNPDVPSVDTTALSSTSADVYSAFSTIGYSFSSGPFSLEPYMSADYRNIEIDGYREADIKNDGHDFVVDSQSIDSLEGVYALRCQVTLSNPWGVFVPFVDYQYHKEYKDGNRTISAKYVGAEQALSAAAAFDLPTDNIDADYEVWAIGVNAVLRGSRQTTADGPASGGVQGFINYRTYNRIKNYSQDMIAFGLRYEF